MATASLNIKLDYNQVLELARQLSEEEKELLKLHSLNIIPCSSLAVKQKQRPINRRTLFSAI